MKIFNGFLIVFSVVFLILLPITEATYNFRTDVETNAFFWETGGAGTTANVTLLKPVYNGDIATIGIMSSDWHDTPGIVAYCTTNRLLDINGLVISTNRTLTVSYDVDALNATGAISIVMDRLNWLWLICVIVFAPAALASMLIRRHE